MTVSIDIRGVSKTFGEYTALEEVSLDIRPGELLALLGPSGSGKTTLLRIIAGLETADGGSILFSGEDAMDRHPRDRGVGFVFQHYALFRHMTVFENIAFGLRVRPRGQRPTEAEIGRRVHELLDLVQLDWLADRYPAQLSGGQRQRIALARALAIEPKVLLLDEPFGALDAKVRKDLRRWLRRLHDEVHVTMIFVTHDQEEALELADRVVVMNQGRIEQVDTPAAVYHSPATAFVYEFLGDANVLPVTVTGGVVTLAGGLILGRADAPDGEGTAYLRPSQIDLFLSPQGGPATLQRSYAAGPSERLEVRLDDHTLEIHRAPGAEPLPPSLQGYGIRMVGGAVFIGTQGPFALV